MKTCKGHIDELPKKFHDNEYIKTGYRLHHKGWKEVFFTMFKCHNETFNVWSHFIGKLCFLGMAIYIISSFPNMEKDAVTGAMDEYDTQKALNESLTMEDFLDAQAFNISSELTLA
mgnify:CR=1 FL=1